MKGDISKSDSSLNDQEMQALEAKYEISTDCSERELLAVSKLYARDIANNHNLTVDVSELDWEVSKRAKRRAGAVRHNNGVPKAVVLSWKFFKERGWAAVASNIRHELIHVHLMAQEGDTTHGPAFKRLAEDLNTEVHYELFVEPKWWVTCTNCGTKWARYRRSKLVENTDQFECGECGGKLQLESNESKM